MSIKSYFSSLFNKVEASGSAFVKVAELDAQALEAKGKIVAIDAANTIKNKVVASLETEVNRVHGDLDALKTRVAAVLAKL